MTDANTISSEAQRLLELAEAKFGELTKAEKKLFQKVADGGEAIYSSCNEKIDDPANAQNWGEDRLLKADRIVWLCTNSEAMKFVSHKGIIIIGARIDGEIDLSFAVIPFQLTFIFCVIHERISLLNAEIGGLFLSGSHIGSITADRLNVKGAVFLRNDFKADGEVRFTQGTIGGDFDCSNSQFSNKNGYALNADGVNVKGTVLLSDGFKVKGEVRLVNANISGNFDCKNGQFSNERKKTLSADRLNVIGSVFFRDGFISDGEVQLLGATIGGNLDCLNGHFKNKGGYAITADALNVKKSVHMRDGFRAEGEVRLTGAIIGGDLSCTNCQFSNKGGNALSADGLEIKGNIYMRDGFKSEGAVRLMGAIIGGNFECTNGQFSNNAGYALIASGLYVKGIIYLRDGFRSDGEVQLLGTTVEGNLDCKNGQFSNKNGYAFNADGLDVKGSIYMRNGFKADGVVSLINLIVEKHFHWTGVTEPENTILDLRSACVGTLVDDEKSFPSKGNLYLQGFEYKEIGLEAPTDAKTRTKWLNLQPVEKGNLQKPFHPQPYEQLARVLGNMGYDVDARRIQIQKVMDKKRYTNLNCSEKILYYITGPTIGFGYFPFLALNWIYGFILLGCLMFCCGFQANVMTATKGSDYQNIRDYPIPNPLIYSIDMFVPLVDLHHAKYWLPDAKRKGELKILNTFNVPIFGRIMRWYMWVHILCGWLLTSLLVVGLSGLVRR